MDKLSLNVMLFSPFVGIAKMLQGSANQNIFGWTIISFICALISKHNAKLGHKLIQNFSENYFQIFTMMHETLIGTENYQTMTIFCVHHSMHSPKCMRFLMFLTLILSHVRF